MSKEATKENPNETADVFMDPNTFKDGGHLNYKTDKWSENGNHLIYSVTKKGSDW